MKYKGEDYVEDCDCEPPFKCNCYLVAERKALFACVDDFADVMKSKLMKAMADKGKSGWDNPKWKKEDIIHQLLMHIHKGDMIDVANFAMFIWNQE